MEYLALEVFDLGDSTGSQYAVLEPDATITITDTSEIFADGDVWSYDFKLNVYANAHLFGTAGDIHGSRLHEQINKRKARLWVEGTPLYLGYLKLGSEAEVDAKGNIDVRFESGQKTFEEMIDGAKANQVPMMGDVQIGVALWRKRKVKFRAKLSVSATYKKEGGHSDSYYRSGTGPVAYSTGGDEIRLEADGEKDGEAVQMYPRMVFPQGEFMDIGTGAVTPIDAVNTDFPYDDGHPYCNTALCYQKYDYKSTDKDGNVTPAYDAEPEAQRGYEYMPANRVNSAPNFFVLYWLKALMTHLGIYIEENQMMDIEDLRRLFFVNTNCAYREPKVVRGQNPDSGYNRYRFLADKWYLPEYYSPEKIINKEESGFAVSNVDMGSHPLIENFSVKVTEIMPWNEEEKNYYIENNCYLHDAFATSDCFPNVDISEVIGAIENGFGVRFLFSSDYKRVRIVLLRNVFRSEAIQEIACEIADEDVKVENSVRGFRMTYGESEDTHFFYKGFDDKLPRKKPYFTDSSDDHDYSHWDLNATYEKIINRVSAFDKTCYVTPNTGDSYIIKVDKDAKRLRDLHPSLFEGAGYMDAEDGDCSGEDETVKTIDVGFKPAIVNDLNMEQEREGNYDQRFALFVDETMRPRREDLKDGQDYNNPDTIYDVNGKLYAKDENGQYVYHNIMAGDGIVKPGEFAITSDATATASGLFATVIGTIGILPKIDILSGFSIDGHVNEGYRLYLQDNYEPNDDGVSPVEKHDWGLTLGIMRGSGDDAYVRYEDDPDDGEGNDTWRLMPGSSVTAHPDTCDNYGNLWDYDTEPSRSYEAYYLQAAGWSVTAGSDGMASCTYHFILNGIDFLCTPIKYTRPGARPDWKPVLTKTELEAYVTDLWNQYGWNFGEHDWWKLILSAKDASGSTAYADGRISLKLRAEKPNPYFNPKQPVSDSNRRYLQITNKNLQQRGLCDQFYKEYSYWIRNARIVKRTVRMTLAQLQTIDKTKRVRVGDVTGFIRKMQYSVSNQTGLGNVVMEIMYI